MQNWDDLKFCLALERYQTMTAAARALGTNTATVSRRIDRLTEEAGEPLFLRDNTQWRATDMGRELAQIALRIEDRISRAATETMEQQKIQILRINANEATLNAQLVQNIASFSENYHNLNLTLSSHQASLAYGETDIILTHVAPTEGRIIRKKVGDLCVRAYRNAMLEAPTTGWIATAHGVDEAVEASDIFAEFGDMPQFTLHSLDMTVEVMRTSACAALLPARYAERFAHLDVIEHIPEQSLPVWACYHYTRKTDHIIKDALDWIEQSFHRLQ